MDESKIEKLKQEFEEFERQFDAFEARLKKIKSSFEYLEIENMRESEKLQVELNHLAMLERHGIEIKS